MRGAPWNDEQYGNREGIIPAYAGSTDSSIGPSARRQDHPRVCGEHCCLAPLDTPSEGSSPRMRGALHVGLAPGGAHGIIPAYAGSTLAAGSSAIASRDHPRVCGEHGPDPQILRETAGSSPRMRGARDGIQALSALGRIIPAYAGSTWVLLCTVMICPDHPRVCGEHAFLVFENPRVMGSSPRMRGARHYGCSGYFLFRIIPAYAGST